MLTYGIDGATVAVRDQAGNCEIVVFENEYDAIARVAICVEAIEWCGTPYRHHGGVKGPKGCVDCAMLLRECYVRTKRLPPFDPRQYSIQWHLHRDEELFIQYIEEKLRGKRVGEPRLGDVVLYKFGRLFSHGAIYVGLGNVVHAHATAKRVVFTAANDINLLCHRDGLPRERLFYEVNP